MRKYFTFDNEPITGWTFFWRNIIGTFALILFIIPGFWIWSANAYKRAGTFQWSKEMEEMYQVVLPLRMLLNL